MALALNFKGTGHLHSSSAYSWCGCAYVQSSDKPMLMTTLDSRSIQVTKLHRFCRPSIRANRTVFDLRFIFGPCSRYHDRILIETKIYIYTKLVYILNFLLYFYYFYIVVILFHILFILYFLQSCSVHKCGSGSCAKPLLRLCAEPFCTSLRLLDLVSP